MKIGDRVFITDQKHPWIGKAGDVISGEETYGLGWKGYRVRLDGTCGQECYVRPDQVMGPGRVDKITTKFKRKAATRTPPQEGQNAAKDGQRN